MESSSECVKSTNFLDLLNNMNFNKKTYICHQITFRSLDSSQSDKELYIWSHLCCKDEKVKCFKKSPQEPIVLGDLWKNHEEL